MQSLYAVGFLMVCCALYTNLMRFKPEQIAVCDGQIVFISAAAAVIPEVKP